MQTWLNKLKQHYHLVVWLFKSTVEIPIIYHTKSHRKNGLNSPFPMAIMLIKVFVIYFVKEQCLYFPFFLFIFSLAVNLSHVSPITVIVSLCFSCLSCEDHVPLKTHLMPPSPLPQVILQQVPSTDNDCTFWLKRENDTLLKILGAWTVK